MHNVIILIHTTYTAVVAVLLGLVVILVISGVTLVMCYLRYQKKRRQ